ncbi:MAG: nucleotide exchange factor GrpE [Erysipelotrichales bacterium]|nr:nucleotide exchange factor GrpE [Erysipelotrichales bacterium]
MMSETMNEKVEEIVEESEVVEEATVEVVDEATAKIEELTKEIEELKRQLTEAKNDYYKAYADAENRKKRLQQDFDTNMKYRIQSFALDILPAIDNFERALSTPTEDEALKNYQVGFKMIYDQLMGALKKEGVEQIEALDKPFDPNFHNAIMAEKVEGVESDMVIQEFQKGYILKDRLIRPSMVKVSE